MDKNWLEVTIKIIYINDLEKIYNIRKNKTWYGTVEDFYLYQNQQRFSEWVKYNQS